MFGNEGSEQFSSCGWYVVIFNDHESKI